MWIPLVLFEQGEVANFPLMLTFSVHVSLNIRVIHESVNTLMIETAILSCLM